MSAPTKACPHCGAQIAAQAVMCPECRADLAKKKNWFGRHPVVTVILSLLVLGVGIGIIAAATGEKKTETSEAKQEVKQETKQEEAPTVVDAAAFVAEFDANKIVAQDKYNKKIIQTTAWIANISGGDFGGIYIVLNPAAERVEQFGGYAVTTPYYGTTIQCHPEKADVVNLKNGQQVTVKGRVDDQTLGIIQLKDCSVVK